MAFTTNIDEALGDIADGIQIDKARMERMKSAYNHLVDVINADDEFFSQFNKKIEAYPQGSVALGTTIKPESGDEYDLDLVLHIRAQKGECSSEKLYNELKRVIVKRYGAKSEPKNRCVRINYAGDFHMDVLPGFSESSHSNVILIPDTNLSDWTISNPKDYAEWFKQTGRKIKLDEQALFSAEELNLKEFTNSLPLKQSVKLLKMYRNEFFKNDVKNRTPSVLLTTVAGIAYKSSPSIYKTIESFILTAQKMVDNGTLWCIKNPKEPRENFSERLNSKNFAKFNDFLQNLKEKWIEMKDKTLSEAQKEALFSGLFSMENFDAGFEHFSERMRNAKATRGDYSGLELLAESGSGFDRPYTYSR